MRSSGTKDSRNVINIISGIAAAGVAIGSLAMIIVLSAFNGLESLVADLYTSVDPDVRISPIKGKVFSLDSTEYDEVAQWPEISGIAPVLEETVFLQYEDQQSIVTLRGIPESYLPISRTRFTYLRRRSNAKVSRNARSTCWLWNCGQPESILRSGCRINQSICGKAGRSKIVEPASKV